MSALQDYLEDDEARGVVAPEPKVFIVAVYLIDRAYGGPEEGGWYYEAGELVRQVRLFKNEEAAMDYSRRLNKWLQRTLNKGRRPISSVLSEGCYCALVYGDYAPKYYPEETPHYE